MKIFTSATSVFVRVITFGLVLSALCLTAEARQGTGRAVSPKSQAQVQALVDQAVLASRQGQNEKALAYYQKALYSAQVAGDKSQQATILNNIGLVYSHTGQPQKALDYFQQALPIRKAVGDKAGEATTLNNIGVVYSDTGQHQKALAYYQQALSLAQAAGDKSQQATTLSSIDAITKAASKP